jgi:hypothetical protein
MICGPTINAVLQQRSVRELEQKEASGKGDEAMIFKQNDTAYSRRVLRVVIGGAAGPAEVNVGGPYPQKRHKQRKPHARGH